MGMFRVIVATAIDDTILPSLITELYIEGCVPAGKLLHSDSRNVVSIMSATRQKLTAYLHTISICQEPVL